MNPDIEIARAVKIKHINDIAQKLGIPADDLELYGKYKAKLPLKLIDESKIKQHKLILVTAITPTQAGEGKTTVSIGLSEGLNQIGTKTTVVLREPSLGPVFGMKGGATGGGYAQVIPMEDINLHFTGDIAAVEKAHNLLSALIDNNIQNIKHSLCIDPRTVLWRRTMDMNDRALRNIMIGLGGTEHGIPRVDGFLITAASEVMASLCMSNDLINLKERLANIFIGFTFAKEPIFARDLKAQGAMAALLKDAIKPNLVQTIEGNPAIIHGGPFGNIAQGTNSIIATRMGLSLSDYVVTEAGFGTDLGAEKFLDIKCRNIGVSPAAVVIVATIRALKYHGGVKSAELTTPNLDALNKGFENLEKHIENIRHFNITPVVAINKFVSDTEEEVNLIKEKCKALGVHAEVIDAWAKGGKGAFELAKIVKEIAEKTTTPFTPLYDLNWTIEKKIETIASKIYGAKSVEYSPQAKADINKIKDLHLENLPICMAKTQKSLSDNPKLLGRPKDFILKIREIEIASGAGFIIPISGNIIRMPGLPPLPAAESIDIDKDGNIYGLF